MDASPRPYFIWDYDLSEADVRAIVRGDDEEQKAWLVARLLESARYEDIWQYISLAELRAIFPKLQLKPQPGVLKMNSTLTVNLPNELLIYKERIESTIKPFIEIKTSPGKNLPLWKSKFGGLPYFPKSLEYPADSKGQAMFLLAQINFGETPKLDSFPEKGILQFFISNGNNVYGACFENPAKQDDFKVLYFPEVTEDESLLVTEFNFLPKPEYLPIEKQSSLIFSLKHAPLPTADYRFEATILAIDPNLKYDLFTSYQKVYEEYGRLFSSEGHKIGGYPYFTQSDPREYETYQGEDYILLFQMDTDDKAGIMWGDCGVANFFISERDLVRRDFSRVLYNWDCC